MIPFMDIIHFGDIHCWQLNMPLNDLFYPKRYLGTANLWLNRRKKFPPILGRTVLQEIEKQDADLLVFSGDLTTQSLPAEFATAAELFKPLRKKWGSRFILIPGNHDRYTPKSVKKQLFEKHFPYGQLNSQRLLVREIDDQSVAIGFDASRPFKIRSNGLMDDELTTALRDELSRQQTAEKRVVLVGHFPASYPSHVPAKWDHELIDRHKLQALIDEFNPLCYLHGHKHERWRMDNQINCGAAGMTSSNPSKHAGFVRISLDGSAISTVTGYAMRPDLSGMETFEIANQSDAT